MVGSLLIPTESRMVPVRRIWSRIFGIDFLSLALDFKPSFRAAFSLYCVTCSELTAPLLPPLPPTPPPFLFARPRRKTARKIIHFSKPPLSHVAGGGARAIPRRAVDNVWFLPIKARYLFFKLRIVEIDMLARVDISELPFFCCAHVENRYTAAHEKFCCFWSAYALGAALFCS